MEGTSVSGKRWAGGGRLDTLQLVIHNKKHATLFLVVSSCSCSVSLRHKLLVCTHNTPIIHPLLSSNLYKVGVHERGFVCLSVHSPCESKTEPKPILLVKHYLNMTKYLFKVSFWHGSNFQKGYILITFLHHL